MASKKKRKRKPVHVTLSCGALLRLHKTKGVGYVLIDGARRYVGPFYEPGTKRVSRTAVKRAERLIAERGDGGEPADDLTVAELVIRFLEAEKGNLSKSEYDCYRSALRPLLDLYDDEEVRNFKPSRLRAVRERMIAERNWARTTVNAAVKRLKRVFRWGCERDLVPGSVFHGLTAVRGLTRTDRKARETEPVTPVCWEHVDAVLGNVSSAVAAMIRLQWLTGMRPGEVVTMRGSEIDRTGSIWLYRPTAHKTAHLGHDRVVALGPKAQRILADFIDRPETASLFDPREAEAARNARRKLQRATPRTPSQRRRRRKAKPKRAPRECYSVDSYRRAIYRACVATGTPVWTPHRIRHSAGTRVAHESGTEAARAMLGHRSITTTEIYVERDIQTAVDVAARSG